MKRLFLIIVSSCVGLSVLAGGVDRVILNSNRNSTNKSAMVFTALTSCPTGYVTRLASSKWGANGFKQTVGGDTGNGDGLILKQNTTYSRTIISGAAANIIQFSAGWLEMTDKD